MVKKLKNLFYLDRDTDIIVLAKNIFKALKINIVDFLEQYKNRLQGKEAGDYYTIEVTVNVRHGELENMNRFFRAAVIPYYARQEFGIWDYKIPSRYIKMATEKIKRDVGFILYDHTGHPTKEVNSLSSFRRIKDLNDFLTMVQEVCFEDHGYIFPDSEYFKELEKEKGRTAAQKQVYHELKEKIKNKYKDREIV